MKSCATLRLTVMLVSILVLGCSGTAGDSASPARLAFVTNTAADFWTMARKGTEQADLELAGAEVEFQIADGTAADQRRIEFGYQAIRLMADIVSGNRSGIPASKQILVPTLVIRRDNVDEFSAKVSRLKG